MPHDDAAEHDERQGDDKQRPTPWYRHPGLQLIFIAAAILFGMLIMLYGAFGKPPGWVQFWVPQLVNIVLLMVIIFQAFINTRQWEATRDSLEETRKIVAQNERAVAASEAQARASELSAKTAERNAEAMQQALVASERAYIGIREINIVDLSVGEIPTLSVTWYNGGKTPASHFRAITYLVFGETPEKKGYFINDDWSDSRGSFLPAGVSQTVRYPQVEIGFKPVTKEMLTELEGGSKRLYAMVSALSIDFTGQQQPFEASYIFNSFDWTFTELYEYSHETNPK